MPSSGTSRDPCRDGEARTTLRVPHQTAVTMAVVLAALATVPSPNKVAAEDAMPAWVRLAQINPDASGRSGGSGQPGDALQPSAVQSPFLLVTFPLSAPDSVADEVAAQYRILPIARHESMLLGHRIVLYRMPDDGNADRLIAALRTDRRVANVQFDRQYLALPRVPAPPHASGPPAHASPQASTDRRRAAADAQLEPGRAQGVRKGHNPASRPAVAEAAGITRGPQRSQLTDASPRRSAALGSELRWPTADEPFVGPATR